AAEQRRQQEYEQQPRRPGRAPNWEIAHRVAGMVRRQAAERLTACQERQERVRQAVRGLGDDYTPSTRTAVSRWRPLRSRGVWSSAWPWWRKSWRRRSWGSVAERLSASRVVGWCCWQRR